MKINVVALKGANEDEFEPMVRWAHARRMAITYIEVMPLGEIEASRFDQYLPLTKVRAQLARRFTLNETDHRTGGPVRYVRASETDGLIGFITPLTHNFCESCTRVQVTCTGTLYMCLGNEDAAECRRGMILSLTGAMARPAVARHMSVTGG